MAVLKVENLSYRYSQHRVLENVNLEIEKGDFACITGSNGSGKSTLLKLLLGKLSLQSGDIQILSQNITHFKQWHRIGYLPQTLHALNSGFPATAEEIVRTGLFYKTGLFKPFSKGAKTKALESLELVGMKNSAKALIGNLSGGQQQRVLLAKVLSSSPELMLLDEPSTGVDPSTALALYNLLKKLSVEQGITILMVTHDVQRSTKFATKVFCLEDGNMVTLEKSQLEAELAHKHKHPPHSNCCESHISHKESELDA